MCTTQEFIGTKKEIPTWIDTGSVRTCAGYGSSQGEINDHRLYMDWNKNKCIHQDWTWK